MLIECRCGAVAVELSVQPIAHFYCHCVDCQAVHGAAFVSVALYPAASVAIARGALRASAVLPIRDDLPPRDAPSNLGWHGIVDW